MKKILSIILSIFTISNILIFTTAVPVKAYDFETESGLYSTGFFSGHVTTKEIYEKSLSEIIGTVIQAILAFLGVFFLILMIYGGYIWMMARGNEQEVARAKNIIINALIGLIIVLAAYAITLIAYKFYIVREYAG